jgi:hypothetical protein
MRINLALGACALAAAVLMALRGGSMRLGESPNEPKPTARQRESVMAAANAASKLKGESEDKHRAKLILASEAARTDPETALALARDLPPSSARDELIARAVAQWAASSPEDAAAWLEQQEMEPSRDLLFATLATVWADSDPSAAARYALENLPPGRLLDNALVGIVQRWTQRAPAAAAAWVARFPEGPLRDASMENVTKLWTNQDPQAPGPWLKSITAGTSRDNAIRAYAEQLAPSSPTAAAEWAATIDNPELREKQLAQIREMGNHGTIFE